MTQNATYWIEKLQMTAHPEGGFYKETYRSADEIETSFGTRNISTAIYFLLQDFQKSHFHKIKSDEQWFHHLGETLEISYILNNKLHQIYLGNNPENGEVLQATIPANTWFASRLKNGSGFGLVSCTVAPGFDFRDFEMAKKADLLVEFPALQAILEEMCLS
jgi:predicted cupin superfamily sugar epimerase